MATKNTEPKVSTTSTTKNRRNLFGQNVKVTKTNTRTDYGNKVVDKKTKNKEVSVSPKKTVLKGKLYEPSTWSISKNKKAKKQMAANPEIQEAKGADRIIKRKDSEKVTTYGGTKKNIFGKEKPGTTVKRNSSSKLTTLGNVRAKNLEPIGRAVGSMYGAAFLFSKKKKP
jgi:hypothetical protein